MTKADKQPTDGGTALVIPNKEIRLLYMHTVSEWFEETLDQGVLQTFVLALTQGDAASVQETITDILYATISFFDSAEQYYNDFLTGLLRGAGLPIAVNRENELCRSAIVSKDYSNKRAICIKLKYAKEYEDLETKAWEALQQIEENQDAWGLSPRIQHVLKYGIVFWKKECAVKFLENAS